MCINSLKEGFSLFWGLTHAQCIWCSMSKRITGSVSVADLVRGRMVPRMTDIQGSSTGKV